MIENLTTRANYVDDEWRNGSLVDAGSPNLFA